MHKSRQSPRPGAVARRQGGAAVAEKLGPRLKHVKTPPRLGRSRGAWGARALASTNKSKVPDLLWCVWAPPPRTWEGQQGLDRPCPKVEKKAATAPCAKMATGRRRRISSPP